MIPAAESTIADTFLVGRESLSLSLCSLCTVAAAAFSIARPLFSITYYRQIPCVRDAYVRSYLLSYLLAQGTRIRAADATTRSTTVAIPIHCITGRYNMNDWMTMTGTYFKENIIRCNITRRNDTFCNLHSNLVYHLRLFLSFAGKISLRPTTLAESLRYNSMISVYSLHMYPNRERLYLRLHLSGPSKSIFNRENLSFADQVSIWVTLLRISFLEGNNVQLRKWRLLLRICLQLIVCHKIL